METALGKQSLPVFPKAVFLGSGLAGCAAPGNDRVYDDLHPLFSPTTEQVASAAASE
jgi:hypothetical protein